MQKFKYNRINPNENLKNNLDVKYVKNYKYAKQALKCISNLFH